MDFEQLATDLIKTWQTEQERNSFLPGPLEPPAFRPLVAAIVDLADAAYRAGYDIGFAERGKCATKPPATKNNKAPAHGRARAV